MRNDLDHRLVAADPASELPDVPQLEAAAQELRAAIVSTSPGQPRTAGATAVRRSLRGRPVALALASILLAIAGTLGWQALDGRDGIAPAPEQAWAREIMEIAAVSPRLLPSQPGWRIDRADSFRADDGEVSFTRGQLSADLTWTPRSMYEDRVKGRTLGSKRYGDVKVGSTNAVVIRYASTEDDFAALWIHGEHTLELRSNMHIPKELQGVPWSVGEGDRPEFFTGFSYETFRALLASLQEVSIDEWLSAMPDSVVRPGQAEDAVDEMLADIPQPEGFARASVIDEDAVRDRYQLGAKVTGAVTCGWARQWVEAIRDGNDQRRDEAADAMAGARDWKILVEMQDEGAYPDVIWELADVMQTSALPSGPNRRMFTEENLAQGLGC